MLEKFRMPLLIQLYSLNIKPEIWLKFVILIFPQKFHVLFSFKLYFPDIKYEIKIEIFNL